LSAVTVAERVPSSKSASLAEDVAAALEREHDLATVLIRDRHLHRPGDDHVEVAPRVVAVENDLALGEALRAHARGELDPVAR